VYFQDGGPGVSQVRIRGVSASEGGVPSTTASYFGEAVTSVLTNHGGKPNLRLVDIDRVEVIRGPQGTLFGANSLAGVVRRAAERAKP
jgi:outer membrane receptor protein involved in Fe transport